MVVLEEHIRHHQQLAALYEDLLGGIEGVTFHKQPSGQYDSNYWLNTITLSQDLHVPGEERAYESLVKGAEGGAAGVIHAADSIHTGCEPNRNVEALRMALDAAGIESRPLWKPMHRQPVYKDVPAYVNGVSEGLFKRGLCLPSGPWVSEEDARYIVGEIQKNVCR